MTTVWIPATALAAMVTEADRLAPLETGGILVGYSVGRSEIVVTKSVGPGPRAVHEKTRFVPDADFHEAAVADAYCTSGRRHGYLGDWHSHPNGEVDLSNRDRRVLKAIAAATEARMEFPIMAILGGSPPFDLGIWRYSGYRRRAMRSIGRTIERCAVTLYESPG